MSDYPHLRDGQVVLDPVENPANGQPTHRGWMREGPWMRQIVAWDNGQYMRIKKGGRQAVDERNEDACNGEL